MAIRINGKIRDSLKDYKVSTDDLGNESYDQSADLTSSKGQHGTYHLADNPNIYEIQRNNNFEFIVYFGEDLYRAGLTLDGGINNISDSNKFGSDVAQEVLRMSVSSSFVPHFTQNAIEVKRGNTTIKYASTPTFSSGQIKFYDYIGAETKAILMAWQNLSYNVSTERVGHASEYKKTAHLIEYSPDFQKVREWELHGCWIESLSEDEFSSENSEKHTVSVTINYDRAEIVNS